MPEEDYQAHDVKQDPSTGYLAKFTGLGGEKAWQVYRPDGPPHFVAHQDVEQWTDLTRGGVSAPDSS